jgi:hypothetical protein
MLIKKNVGLVWLLWLAALPLLTGCGLQKDIDVPLPAYTSELVVECYLENGKVPRLAVSESVAYLSPTLYALPPNATVQLTLPNGRVIPFDFRPQLDTTVQKIYTHVAREAIAARPGDTFRLDVRDDLGRYVTGSATMMPTVPIDSVRYRFNNLTGANREASVLTWFKDPPTGGDYYFLTLHDKPNLNKEAARTYNIDDRLVNGQNIPITTLFRFDSGDTITATLYHTDPAYYRFRQSARDARSANGNPFGQPSAVYSTVQGGIGVFTVLSYTRQMTIIP